MGVPIRKPFVLLLGGTSLTAGRLCNPPLPWTYYLWQDMIGSPECKGPVRIINTGKGSQTSNFGASQAALMAPLRPSHVLMEDFAINDCAIGPVSIPQATANFDSMVASYRAENPGVIIVHQTMSPATATDVNRTNLASYYTNGIANAVRNGLETLDNYYGTALVPGGWPKPLNPALTVGYAPLANTPSGYSYLTDDAWNPADKNADITLSNSNLSAARTGAPGSIWVSCRGLAGTSSGKVYFQVTSTVLGGADQGIGIASNAVALNNYIGVAGDAIAYYGNGNVLQGGGVVASYAGYAPGDVIGVAVDLVNNRIWFRKNTGNWNNSGVANPSTNVGGLAIAANTYYPALSFATQTTACTAAFGNAGDGLHPVWPAAFQTYSYPNILAWARRAMAAYWPD